LESLAAARRLGTLLASYGEQVADVPIRDRRPPVSNALVPLASIKQAAAHSRGAGRPHAEFIAHLIATSGKAPQTRARRRAEPEDAIAAYGALSQWPSVPGRKLSRSL
jgi:hypothetical protein